MMESNTVCCFSKWEIEDSVLSSRWLQFWRIKEYVSKTIQSSSWIHVPCRQKYASCV